MKGFIEITVINNDEAKSKCRGIFAVNQIVALINYPEHCELVMTYHNHGFCHYVQEPYEEVLRLIEKAQKEGGE